MCLKNTKRKLCLLPNFILLYFVSLFIQSKAIQVVNKLAKSIYLPTPPTYVYTHTQTHTHARAHTSMMLLFPKVLFREFGRQKKFSNIISLNVFLKRFLICILESSRTGKYYGDQFHLTSVYRGLFQLN